MTYREEEEGVGAVEFHLGVTHMLLAWGVLYWLKNYMAKAHGMTFVPLLEHRNRK